MVRSAFTFYREAVLTMAADAARDVATTFNASHPTL
jgi:hypothetical protein